MTDKANPFDGENLSGTTYRRANMSRVAFDGVDLTEARFHAVLEGATFTDTNLASAVFDDVSLAGARFGNVNLAGTAFDNVNLSDVTIENANLSGLRIARASVEGMRIDDVLVTELFAAWERERARSS